MAQSTIQMNKNVKNENLHVRWQLEWSSFNIGLDEISRIKGKFFIGINWDEHISYVSIDVVSLKTLLQISYKGVFG